MQEYELLKFIKSKYQVRFEIIEHDLQNYNTPGDYYFNEGTLVFAASMLPDIREPMAIIIHEVTEVALLMKKHPTMPLKDIIEMVEAFDHEFEARRAAGLEAKDAEPGDHPDAPYYMEHQEATKAERAYIERLGINWEGYDDRVTATRDTYTPKR